MKYLIIFCTFLSGYTLFSMTTSLIKSKPTLSDLNDPTAIETAVNELVSRPYQWGVLVVMNQYRTDTEAYIQSIKKYLNEYAQDQKSIESLLTSYQRLILQSILIGQLTHFKNAGIFNLDLSNLENFLEEIEFEDEEEQFEEVFEKGFENIKKWAPLSINIFTMIIPSVYQHILLKDNFYKNPSQKQGFINEYFNVCLQFIQSLIFIKTSIIFKSTLEGLIKNLNARYKELLTETAYKELSENYYDVTKATKDVLAKNIRNIENISSLKESFYYYEIVRSLKNLEPNLNTLRITLRSLAA